MNFVSKAFILRNKILVFWNWKYFQAVFWFKITQSTSIAITTEELVITLGLLNFVDILFKYDVALRV